MPPHGPALQVGSLIYVPCTGTPTDGANNGGTGSGSGELAAWLPHPMRPECTCSAPLSIGCSWF